MITDIFCVAFPDFKPPSALDIPLDFNVTFTQVANTSQYNVLGSKPATEPAMVLGCGPYFALKMAVYAARADAGLKGWFELPLPATPDRTQSFCGISTKTLAAALDGSTQCVHKQCVQ